MLRPRALTIGAGSTGAEPVLGAPASAVRVQTPTRAQDIEATL